MKASTIIKRIKEHNRLRGVTDCTTIRGNENLQQLAALLTSHQGITFAKQTKFPTLDIMRDERVKPILFDNAIVVDKDITVANVPFIVLAGKGHSHITYDSNARAYTIVLMHGHKATITAKNGALVSLHNIASSATIIEENYGKVIKL